ncbi:LOW QUALITY PROTEIN: sal-like protein 4 [Hyla sarda]|uniref:LOW QUALITY PROTEIN: sal-like protein 4 n=1 Tax=Hyla sarda TaxID=327740 RepID=UPI0024C46D80|nr:LOW QUALITY PROTEIN: sal-like protein 4 [Hyla sarda]
MSRRKQAKPQHLNSEGQQRGEACAEAQDCPSDTDGERSVKRCRMEETHVCDKCCAEFFDQSEFIEHKKNCTKNQPVLIMNVCDGEGTPDLFPEASSVGVHAGSGESKAEQDRLAKGSSVLAQKMDGKVDSANKTVSQSASKTNGFGYLPKTTVSNSNVTLQTINTTKVAVNQHSSDGISNPANNPNAIPMILEQLVCLQQQQLQQIQLTEQIRIQIAMMAPNSLHPSIAAATDPLKALGAHLSQQLTAAVALIGQKAGTQNLTLETLKQSKLPHTTIPVAASGTVPIRLSSPLIKTEVTRGIPSSISRFTNPVLPHSPGTVIFQNPLGLNDPSKKLKSKFPGVATSEGKPNNNEDQFFRHKCKFCGKVFGNDSALQIHLRSHTGERPYKCNICGNRFTTKGNLKVHFQRHREKYPHIRMNPYPVPEHLDNVPTTTGIPYGMSVPLDESNVFADTKPGLTSLPNSGLTTSNLASIGDSSVAPLPLNLQSKPSPGSEGESVSSGVVGHESGTDQSLNSPTASGSSEQGSETSKLQQLVENIDKSGSDPNECLICHRILSCPSSLKMHYRTHTGERPFKCKICGRAFSTKSNLKTHYGVHRANTPSRVQHSCPICQKKFTNAVVLQQHIRMHMGGQIPNTPVPEDSNEDADIDSSLIDEKNGDLNSLTDDIDDIDMEEDSELGDGPLGSKPPTPQSEVQAESPAQLLELASQDNPLSVSPALNLQRQNSVKSIDNRSVESDGLTNDSSSTGGQDCQNGKSPTQSELRGFSPTNSQEDSLPSKSPPSFNGHDMLNVSSKAEQSEHGSIDAEGDGALDLTNGNLVRKIKEEPGLPHNGDSSRSSHVYIGPPPTLIKVEMPTDRVLGLTQFITPSTLSPGITPLIAPQRRSAKQHLCHTCNKNFSSASALQIHERTHTGEKPFACTICGRAFTTKGNLKVHVGTHMWNNSARRGRRLSMDKPNATLGNDTKKVAEIFPKYLVPPAVGLDPAVWNQYATVLSNGLAMKTNEISVIQSGGIPSLPVSNGGAPIISTATVSNLDVSQSSGGQSMSEMEEKTVESAPKHQFTHFMEENIAVN